MHSMRWAPLQSSSPADVLVRWLIEQRGLQPQRADVTCTGDGACTLIANQDTQAGQVRAPGCGWAMIPDDLVVTAPATGKAEQLLHQ